MKQMIRWFALFFALMPWTAVAQTTQIAPWGPIGNTVSLSVTNTTGTTALGWVGASHTAPPTAWVCNTGANTAYVAIGNSAVAATTASFAIPANSGGAPICAALAVNSGTTIAAITASSTTTITVQTGIGSPLSGLGIGSGGGGGGGGTGCIVPGVADQVLVDNGAGGCIDGQISDDGTNIDAEAVGTLTLGGTTVDITSTATTIVQTAQTNYDVTTETGAFNLQAATAINQTAGTGINLTATAGAVNLQAGTDITLTAGSGAVELGAPVQISGLSSGTCTNGLGIDSTGYNVILTSCPGGSSAFSSLTGGTNTTAAMGVGSGASLSATGSGTITATAMPASGLTGTALPSGIVTSSLTSVGTLASLTMGGDIALGTNSLTGNFTVPGVPIFSGTLTGTQTQCLGLTSGNILAASSGACGSGGGSVNITAATPNLVVTPSPITGTGTIGTTVAQDVQSGATYTIATGDVATEILRTYSVGIMADAVPQATGATWGAGSSFTVCTSSQGDVLTPTTSTVNGAATFTMGPYQCAEWDSDGTNWIASAALGQGFGYAGNLPEMVDVTDGVGIGFASNAVSNLNIAVGATLFGVQGLVMQSSPVLTTDLTANGGAWFELINSGLYGGTGSGGAAEMGGWNDTSGGGYAQAEMDGGGDDFGLGTGGVASITGGSGAPGSGLMAGDAFMTAGFDDATSFPAQFDARAPDGLINGPCKFNGGLDTGTVTTSCITTAIPNAGFPAQDFYLGVSSAGSGSNDDGGSFIVSLGAGDGSGIPGRFVINLRTGASCAALSASGGEVIATTGTGVVLYCPP